MCWMPFWPHFILAKDIYESILVRSIDKWILPFIWHLILDNGYAEVVVINNDCFLLFHGPNQVDEGFARFNTVFWRESQVPPPVLLKLGLQFEVLGCCNSLRRLNRIQEENGKSGTIAPLLCFFWIKPVSSNLLRFRMVSRDTSYVLGGHFSGVNSYRVDALVDFILNVSGNKFELVHFRHLLI